MFCDVFNIYFNSFCKFCIISRILLFSIPYQNNFVLFEYSWTSFVDFYLLLGYFWIFKNLAFVYRQISLFSLKGWKFSVVKCCLKNCRLFSKISSIFKRSIDIIFTIYIFHSFSQRSVTFFEILLYF